jgi:integral membrane sensor domain MASE1
MDEPRIRIHWKIAFLFGLAYLGCAEVGHALSVRTAESSFASFWPPSGLYLAMLLVSAREFWPRLILIAIAANLLSDVVLHARPFLPHLAIAPRTRWKRSRRRFS